MLVATQKTAVVSLGYFHRRTGVLVHVGNRWLQTS